MPTPKISALLKLQALDMRCRDLKLRGTSIPKELDKIIARRDSLNAETAAAADKVKKGGQLLYCTCSIAKDEGEKQIQQFLKERTDFKLRSVKPETFLQYHEKISEDNLFDKGLLRTLPYYEENFGGMDAFFAAVLKNN